METSNKKSIVILAFSLVIIAFGLTRPIVARAATTPSLGTASTYGVLTGTFNYNLGVSTITGVIGSPVLGVTSAVPGGGGSLLLTGTTETATPAYTTAGADQNIALNNAVDGINTQANAGSCTVLPPGPLEGISIGGGPAGTFPPGCYTRAGALNITASGIVTLDGPGTYIFRSSGGAITTGATSIVRFNPLNLGSACDVFWTASGATTLGGASTFLGTVIDDAGISIGAGTTWLGRALAYGSALGNVTADNTNSITVPTCTATTLTLVKIRTNDNGGTAAATDWNLTATGPATISGPIGSTTVTNAIVNSGTYTLSETGPSGYLASSWSCVKNAGAPVAGASIALNSGDTATCTITNNDIAPKLHLIKIITGGTATFANFILTADGTGANDISGTSPVNSAGTLQADTFALSETSSSNYTASAWSCVGGTQSGSSITLGINQEATCTITNTYISRGGRYIPYIPPVPPLIDVVKVPSPLALPAGPGNVAYAFTLRNIGTVSVADIVMADDSCGPLNFISGDTNSNSKLEVNEIWTYTCSVMLSQTHTNTVTATGWANGISATDIANATVVVGLPVVPPLIHVTKIPSPLTLFAGGGMVTYTEKITNPGTVALSNVRLTDDKCSPMKYISGDTNNNSKLEATETWTYTCSSNLAKTTTNTAVASGEANGLPARDFAVATVVVDVMVPKFPNTGTLLEEGNNLLVIVMLSSVFAVTSLFYVIRKKRTL